MYQAAKEEIAKENIEMQPPEVCPKCQHRVPQGSLFCNMCGTSLKPKTTPAAPRSNLRSRSGTVASGNSNSSAKEGTRTQEEKPQAQSIVSEGDSRLKRWVEIIQSRKDIPAFSHTIMKVMSLFGKDETSLSNLTNLIFRDYSLTLAVLRLANSAYYNRTLKPICSITWAVTLIGIETVKRIAGTILLLENYDKRPNGLKELLLLSLLTASHSLETARKIRMHHAEQVYLCGMFRNLGEVLIALYFPDVYKKILNEMESHGLSATDACQRVAEITYEGLGRTMAATWRLPVEVSRAMNSSNHGEFAHQNEEQKIDTIVAFSHELTHCVYRCAPEDRSAALASLIEKFGSIPNLNPEVIQEILDESVTKTKDILTTAGVPLNELHLRRQYELVMQGKSAQGSSSAALAAITDVHSDCKSPQMEVLHNDESLLPRLLAEVQAAVDPGSDPKLNEVLMMVLETCHRGAGFDRVVFCLAARERTEVRGRIGLGLGIEQVISWFRIPLFGAGEPLTLPILAKKDIFIDAATDSRYRESSLVARLGAKCFGLYPVVVDNVVVGCLYVDMVTNAKIPAPKILETITHLRDLVADLIRRTRQMG
jgi:HD-like signal output (HDOD) protein